MTFDFVSYSFTLAKDICENIGLELTIETWWGSSVDMKLKVITPFLLESTSHKELNSEEYAL